MQVMDSLFKECKRYGEILVSEGTITAQDLADAKSSKGSRVISTGLPACCLLQTLLRSAKANSPGILLSKWNAFSLPLLPAFVFSNFVLYLKLILCLIDAVDNCTEITSSNRPKDTIYDWFLNPLLIIKDQIKAENLTESEELYLGKLVLLSGDPVRLKNTNIGSPPESERKQAELDALARRLKMQIHREAYVSCLVLNHFPLPSCWRFPFGYLSWLILSCRLQGITKSISRYPTYRRRFDELVKALSDELGQNNDGSSSKPTSGPNTISRSKSAFARLFSQKSFSFTNKTSNHGGDPESQLKERDVTIA